MPVVDKYASEGKAHKISAVPPPEEVFLEVEKVLEPVFGESRSSTGGAASASTVAPAVPSVVPAVATTATPDLAALATAGQPVTLYSKRPSANWVSPVAPPLPRLHHFSYSTGPGCLCLTMAVATPALAPSQTISASSNCL